MYVIILISRRPGGEDRAFAEYLDLCESDDGVADVMALENLSRSGLQEIYRHLKASGLDRWVKGHYAALSSIAYPDPLYFAARAPNVGMDWGEISLSLLEYWEGRIQPSELANRVDSRASN